MLVLGVSIHQGSDNYLSHGYALQRDENRYYNKQFMHDPLTSLKNARFLLKRDKHLWECVRNF